MKNHITWLACWLACGHFSLAQEQVSVEVLIEGERYLANEVLEARVRVTNHSGQTLHLGQEVDWLTFTVGSYDNKIIARYGEVPVICKMVLENNERGTLRVDLAPYFGIDQPGRYRVIASVNFRELGVVAKSQPVPFDIQKGATMWYQEFGVPKQPGNGGGPPEVRKYAIQTASAKYYLRLSDPTDVKVFKVLPLDGAVSYTTPQTEIDKAGNLHLLYQTGPRSFFYWVIDPDGNLRLRQTHVYSDGRAPKLKKNGSGSPIIENGARKLTPSDLPKADEPAASPAAKPPAL